MILNDENRRNDSMTLQNVYFFCSWVIKEIAFMCGMVWKAIIVRLLTPVDFYDPLPSPDFFVLAELLVLLKCHFYELVQNKLAQFMACMCVIKFPPRIEGKWENRTKKDLTEERKLKSKHFLHFLQFAF